MLFRFIFVLCCIELKDEVKKNKDKIEVKEDSDNKDLIYLDIFDILFWVIFVNRRELVEICWFRGID